MRYAAAFFALSLSLASVAGAVPRQTATARLTGQLVAIHLALPAAKGDEGGCLLEVEVGSAAPLPVLVDLAEVRGGCSAVVGDHLRIGARFDVVFYPGVGVRYSLRAVSVAVAP